MGRPATGSAVPYAVVRKPPCDGRCRCGGRASPQHRLRCQGYASPRRGKALPPQPWVARSAGPTRRRGAVAHRRTPAHSVGPQGRDETVASSPYEKRRDGHGQRGRWAT